MRERSGRKAAAKDGEENGLSLPSIRCLTKKQAAEYLGIGVTLFDALQVPAVRFGRRIVYDRVDLDAWLEEYRRRGRAGTESKEKWLAKPASTGDRIPGSGGSTLHYRTADAYAKALGLQTGKRQKP
jgi:hypothetical protein